MLLYFFAQNIGKKADKYSIFATETDTLFNPAVQK